MVDADLALIIVHILEIDLKQEYFSISHLRIKGEILLISLVSSGRIGKSGPINFSDCKPEQLALGVSYSPSSSGQCNFRGSLDAAHHTDSRHPIRPLTVEGGRNEAPPTSLGSHLLISGERDILPQLTANGRIGCADQGCGDVPKKFTATQTIVPVQYWPWRQSAQLQSWVVSVLQYHV